MEDIIVQLTQRPREVLDVLTDDWTMQFIVSISEKVAAKKPMSTRQGQQMVKVVRRLREAGVMKLLGYPDAMTDSFIERPRYKIAPYESSDIPNEVRYLGDNILGFRCKWIKSVVSEIRNIGAQDGGTPWRNYNYASYDRRQRLWLVPVTSETYSSIIRVIRDNNFKADDAVVDYLYLCDQSRKEPSVFAYFAGGNQIIANVTDNPIIGAWVAHVLFCEPA